VTSPEPGPDRAALLRQLAGNAPLPEPKREGQRLTLPRIEDVRESQPDMASTFERRRNALWEELLRLRDRLSQLNRNEEFSRYQLLVAIFGAGHVDVDSCWVSVHTIRGTNALPAYDAAVEKLILSGCIIVEPTPDN
jgi:hypothetical protein